MSYSIERSEPRLAMGAQVKIALLRDSAWREVVGFTVNVSGHGLLVTLNEAPQAGERVRVKLPPPGDFWGEATVRHVVRGSHNYLVGMKLQEKHGAWLVRTDGKAEGGPQ